MKNFQPLGILAASLMIALASLTATAQDMPDNGPPGGPDGGNPRQMMLQHLQQRLNLTDAQFQSIKPQIEQIMQLRRDLDMRGPGRRPGGPEIQGGPDGNANMQGGPGGPDMQGGPADPPAPDNAAPQDDGNAGNQAASPVQTKLSDLRNALGDGSSSDAEIQQKVAALRAARADAQAALSKAQSNLEKSLTSRQQAELIAMGILD